MKSITAGTILATGCLIVSLSGCQAGKSPLGNLAWWQKNDTLASEYIEPPSHQYTPTDSAVVSDDSDLPPLPPDIEKTVDSFEKDVARSYRELSRQSDKSLDRTSSAARDVAVDTRNVDRSPAYEMPTTGASNPLTPLIRPSERFASKPETPPESEPRLPIRTPYGSEQDSSTFSPDGQGRTQYEKIAGQTLQPFATTQAGSFDASRPEAKIPDFSPSVSSDIAFQPPTSSRTDGNGGFSESLNPATTSRTTESAAEQASQNYPATSYQSFEPRVKEADTQPVPSFIPDLSATIPQNNLAPASASGMSLQLQGQGSYAPGSVRAPNPINPAQLTLPISQPGSTTKH